MLKLSELALLGRGVQQDDRTDPGMPTPGAMVLALDEGRVEDAKQLAQYLTAEGRGLHELIPKEVYERVGREKPRAVDGRH